MIRKSSGQSGNYYEKRKQVQDKKREHYMNTVHFPSVQMLENDAWLLFLVRNDTQMIQGVFGFVINHNQLKD